MTSKRIVVGVGGGIAAFKSASLVSRFVQQGHSLDVVLTHGGRQFVGEATFAALCGRPPASAVYDARYPLGAHIELAANADLLIVAPATARLLASFAYGLADDLLATLYLAVNCPVLVAPAMNQTMWQAAAVQRSVGQLEADGVHFVGPGSGWLSCRESGAGRMAEAEEIFAKANELLNCG